MTWPAVFGEWTSLSEALPSDGQHVILSLRNSEVIGGWYMPYAGPCFYEGNGSGHPIPLKAIVAWMPMPKSAAPSASAAHAQAPS